MIKNLLINLVSGIFFLIIGAVFFGISVFLTAVFQKTDVISDIFLFITFIIYLLFSSVLAFDIVRVIRSFLIKDNEELSKYSSKENYIAIVIKILIYVGIIYVLSIANDYFGEKKVKKIKLDEQKKITENLKKKEQEYYDNRYFKCYGEMTAAHKARGLHQSNREMSIKIKEGICTAYAKGEELNYEGKR